MKQTIPDNVTGAWAQARYEQVRHRLPDAAFPARPRLHRNLLELADAFDGFVFDSFGVLNVGDEPLPGVHGCIEALRARGKRLAVLTNAATVPLARVDRKYAQLGFTFRREEIISSRQVLAHALQNFNSDMLWGVAAPPVAEIAELPCQGQELGADPELYEACDGFILLSSQGWTLERQGLLTRAVSAHPRPVLVGNPDLVAPREYGFSLEPGTYAHALADELGIAPVFYGKPFGNAFELVGQALGEDLDPKSIAMIGDTLHTDVLGGAAAGWQTVLVTDHGLLKDRDVATAIETTGIVPDFILPRI